MEALVGTARRRRRRAILLACWAATRVSTWWEASNRVCFTVQQCPVTAEMAEATDTPSHRSRTHMCVWCESDPGHVDDEPQLLHGVEPVKDSGWVVSEGDGSNVVDEYEVGEVATSVVERGVEG
ncbi:hypothetical protein JHK86_050159 [Glycine max]|nr:hypothetical protein JHK86_050159 [Glycine max]